MLCDFYNFAIHMVAHFSDSQYNDEFQETQNNIITMYELCGSVSNKRIKYLAHNILQINK